MFINIQKTFVSDSRGNVTQYNPGDLINGVKYNNLNTIQKSRFIKKPRAERNKYSVVEYTTMAEVYIVGSTQGWSLDDMYTEFVRRLPNSEASREGVICYICIIRGLDITSGYKGFNNPAQTLVNILNEIDDDRFDLTADIEEKIDTLLKTV